MSGPIEFDEAGLRVAGFEGFVPFAELPEADVPDDPGVYVVLRASDAPPAFLSESAAGTFKGKDPTVPETKLRSNWVEGASVVYIGKASARRSGPGALRRRLDEYRRHGAGEPIGHWGGRLVWQLADHTSLHVCWRSVGTDDAEDLEADLLEYFIQRYGPLPFANLKRGRHRKPSPR